MSLNVRALIRSVLALALAGAGANAGAGDAEFDAEQQSWEAEMARPVEWQLLAPRAVKVDGGARATIADDGTISASGRAAHSDAFTITARTTLRGITAFRIELLPDPKTAGEAVIGELRITDAARRQSVVLQNASSDVEGGGTEVGRIIDHKEQSQWKFPLPRDASRSIVVECAEPVGDAPETELGFQITQNHGAHPMLSRLRIFATTKPHPVRELPAAIRRILAIEPTERSDAQRKEVADFFRLLSASAKKNQT
jgi:hypothetical protein